MRQRVKSMSLLTICDAIAELIEPDETKRVDDRKQPRGGVEWIPGALYLWPRRETFGPDGQGQIDRESFFLRLAWLTDDAIARAGGDEDRAVSDAIDARVAAIRALIAANRARNDEDGAPIWEWLDITAVEYEALSTLENRGVYVDLSGWVGPS